jgi:hypothetical protein
MFIITLFDPGNNPEMIAILSRTHFKDEMMRHREDKQPFKVT